MTHSELPWKVKQIPAPNGCDPKGYVCIDGELGLFQKLPDIVDDKGKNISSDTTQENAEFIVRACNSFHDLISIAQAVKVMGEREESYGCGFYNDNKWIEAREAAQTALESFLKKRKIT